MLKPQFIHETSTLVTEDAGGMGFINEELYISVGEDLFADLDDFSQWAEVAIHAIQGLKCHQDATLPIANEGLGRLHLQKDFPEAVKVVVLKALLAERLACLHTLMHAGMHKLIEDNRVTRPGNCYHDGNVGLKTGVKHQGRGTGVEFRNLSLSSVGIGIVPVQEARATRAQTEAWISSQLVQEWLTDHAGFADMKKVESAEVDALRVRLILAQIESSILGPLNVQGFLEVTVEYRCILHSRRLSFLGGKPLCELFRVDHGV